MNKNSKKSGFTLIEMVIYMGLLSVMLVVLTQTFTSIIQARLESQTTSNVVQDANFIINRFMYDISRATAVSAPSTYGTPTNNLAITVGGNSFQYAVSNGKLELTTNLGTDALNSLETTISNLQFNKIGSNNVDTVQITFTLASVALKSSGEREERDYQFTVAPR